MLQPAMDCLLQCAEANMMNWTAGTIDRFHELNDENNVVALARVFSRAIAGVPVSIHFPNGYEVVVDNGRVVSEPNVVHLAVVGEEGATQVAATLTPAGDDTAVAR